MARRATSFGPKPSFFVVFSFFLFVFSLLLIEKNCFPPPPPKKNKGFLLLILECLPLFLLSLFWPPTCSISLSLSFSLSCYFLSSFSSFFFLLSFGSFFLSTLCFYCFCLLCFWLKKNHNIKYYISKFFVINPFFLGFLSCFLFQIPLSYLCFPDFKLFFLFNMNALVSKQTS